MHRPPAASLTFEEFLACYPRIAGGENPPEDPPADPPEPAPDSKPDDAAFARLRREKEAAEKRAQDTERELEERKRKDAEQAGEWEKLAKQYETEREQARTELKTSHRQQAVAEIARELRFRDPEDVIGRLPDDVLDDRAAIKRDLKKIAEQKNYLIEPDKPERTGLRKVLEDGEPVNEAGPGETASTEAQAIGGGLGTLMQAFGETSPLPQDS